MPRGLERLHEGVHHGSEPLAVQRAGTDVDLGVLLARRLGGVSAVAPVVVGVDVEHDERSAFGDRVQAPAELGVERVVHVEGAGDDGLIERGIADHVQPPRLLRAAVDGLLALAVQIHLEPGAMHDDAGGDEGADLVGVRILLPQPIWFRQDELRGEVRTDVVPVVDRGRDELPTPVAEELERGTLRLAHGPIVVGGTAGRQGGRRARPIPI